MRNGLEIRPSSVWHKVFSEGRETTALLPPYWITIEHLHGDGDSVAAAIQEDRRITVRQLAHALHISKLSVHTILHEKLKMRRVTDCCVPHYLIREQRDCCIEICYE